MFLLFTTQEELSVMKVSFGISVGTVGERSVLFAEVSRLVG